MKLDRHNMIIALIKDEPIATQEELAAALNRVGFNVTQATVSRDIRELKLTKANVDGVVRYVVYQGSDANLNEKYVRILKDGFVSMDTAQNILVIKTVSGMAMAVGAALDAMQLTEIVGTIAGDDTLMCAVRSVEDTKQLCNKLRRILK